MLISNVLPPPPSPSPLPPTLSKIICVLFVFVVCCVIFLQGASPKSPHNKKKVHPHGEKRRNDIHGEKIPYKEKMPPPRHPHVEKHYYFRVGEGRNAYSAPPPPLQASMITGQIFRCCAIKEPIYISYLFNIYLLCHHS